MRIEFVDPYRPSRRTWIIVLAPWVLAAALWALHLHLQSRIEQLRASLHAQELAAKSAASAPAPAAPPPPYLKDALAALSRAAQPEADALKELETVAVAGIQLRSIDVNPDASAVTIELEARDNKVLDDYLDKLNAGMPKPLWHIRRITAGSTGSRPMTRPDVASNATSLQVVMVRDF